MHSIKTVIIAIFLIFTAQIAPYASESLTFSGYAESYYGGGSSATPYQKRVPYVYAFPYDQSIGINHALLNAVYTSDTWFGTLGLQVGQYVNENYAAEPEWLHSIFAASAGYNFNPNWTIEAGIFASHIGLESAIGKDNWTLSRSILADNSPYFESGIKITYKPDQKLNATVLVLNGWQVISDPNSDKGFGTQIQYQLSPDVLLNSSSFIGNEQPLNQASRLRVFHDAYAVIKLSDQWSVAPILDLGFQENGSGWDNWTGAALLAQCRLAPTWQLGFREEYFSDPQGIVTSVSGLNMWSTSINADHYISDKVLFRLEGKLNQSDAQNKLGFLTSLSLSF